MITNNHTTNLVKVCSLCSEQKSVDLFPKRGDMCKLCKYAQNKLYRTNNKDLKRNQDKLYYLSNKELILKKQKQYYELNKEIKTTKQRKYYKNNKKLISIKNKQFYKNNKEIVKKRRLLYYNNNKKICQNRHKNWRKNNKTQTILYARNYHRLARKNNYLYRLIDNIRSRMYNILKKTLCGKTVKTKETFGCTLKELVKHIEFQFKEGMSWEIYGLHTWHIDHIIPLSSFNLSNPEEVKKANHYTNLQPLWAKDNLSKGDKFL